MVFGTVFVQRSGLSALVLFTLCYLNLAFVQLTAQAKHSDKCVFQQCSRVKQSVVPTQIIDVEIFHRIIGKKHQQTTLKGILWAH